MPNTDSAKELLSPFPRIKMEPHSERNGHIARTLLIKIRDGRMLVFVSVTHVLIDRIKMLKNEESQLQVVPIVWLRPFVPPD